MSHSIKYPPDNWAVLRAEEFGTYLVGDTEPEVDAQLLALVTEEGKIQGGFRIALGGSGTMRANVAASSLLAMREADKYRLIFERRPGDIVLRRNGVSTEWFDVDQR